jgi:hypothetical protein
VFPVWWTRSSESARSLVAHRVVAWRSVGRLCPGKINLRSQTLLFRSGRWKAPASSHFEAMQPARAGEPWRAVAATIWRCAMRRPPGSSISHGAHSEIPPPSCKHDGHGRGVPASLSQPARTAAARFRGRRHVTTATTTTTTTLALALAADGASPSAGALEGGCCVVRSRRISTAALRAG